MKNFTLIQLFLTILFLTSCAVDIDYKMPINRFMVPETNGKLFKADLSAAYVSSHKVHLAEAVDPLIFASPSVNNTETVDRSRGIGVKGEMGLVKRLDVYYSKSSDSVHYTGLKFQFLGEPALEKKAKEFKLAIAAAYGMGSEDRSTTVGGGVNAVRTYDVDLDLDAYEVVLLAGYRFNEHILAYVSGFKSEYKAKGSLSSNQFSTVDVNGTSKSHGGNLGVQLFLPESKVYGILEVGRAISTWKGGIRTADNVYGFNMGVRI